MSDPINFSPWPSKIHNGLSVLFLIGMVTVLKRKKREKGGEKKGKRRGNGM